MSSSLPQRRRRAIAAALVAALALGGCQTQQQTGTLGGAAAGAAVGSAFGSGSGKLGAILLGAVIGAIAGAAIGHQLDEADRQRADEAALQAANAPESGRVDWTSTKNPQVHGYAEPLPATPAATGTIYCRDPKSDRAYQLSRAGCPGSDQPISEAEYQAWRQRNEQKVAAQPALAAAGACRHVHEVVYVDGNETSNDVEYCLKAGQWTRA